MIGHIVGCFVALRLEVDLQRGLDARGLGAPWPDLMRDLTRLQVVINDLDGTYDGQKGSSLAWGTYD